MARTLTTAEFAFYAAVIALRSLALRADPVDARQRDALGEAHDRLCALTVGRVGGGGLPPSAGGLR